MDNLCKGKDGLCVNDAEADGYCDECHPLAHLLAASDALPSRPAAPSLPALPAKPPGKKGP